MPLCNLRSIIEILLPGNFGSGMADFILWPIPMWRVPLLYVLPFIFGGLWLLQKNFRLFCYIAVPLFVLNIWTQSHSKYSYNPNAYQDASGEWHDDLDRRDGDTTSFVFRYHVYADKYGVTQEEANYQFWLNNEDVDLVINGVMTQDEDNAMAPTMRDYLLNREQTEKDLAPLHNGSFSDRVKYRWAIDEMNAKPSPLQPFIDSRLKEQADVSYKLWGPIVFGLLAFFIFGYLGKYAIKAGVKIESKVSNNRWDALLTDYNRARVVPRHTSARADDSVVIDGLVTLRYPNLFINDAPFSLDKAEVNEEHKHVIVLKDGTQLYLYKGHVDPVYEQETPKPRTRPQWNMEPIEGTTTKEPRPQPVVTSARRSIFDGH